MVTDKIKNLITNVVIGFDIEKLSEDQKLTNSGIDSLEHMNILLAIEEQYGIKIPDEDIDKCNSIKGIVLYIKKNE